MSGVVKIAARHAYRFINGCDEHEKVERVTINVDIRASIRGVKREKRLGVKPVYQSAEEGKKKRR